MDNLKINDLMKSSPPAKDYQVTLNNWRKYPYNKWAFVNTRQILPTSEIKTNRQLVDNFERNLINMDDFNINHNYKKLLFKKVLIDCDTDAFLIMHRGKLVYEHFDNFTDKSTPHIIFSVSKSLTSLTAGILQENNSLNVDKKISYYLPEIIGSAYEDATIRNLLDMNIASGFVEDYLDTSGIFKEYRNATGWDVSDKDFNQTESGLRQFLSKLPKSNQEHGTKYHYCSPHSDLLGWIIERVTEETFSNSISNLLFKPSGTNYEANVTLDKWGASRSAGGISIAPYDLLKIGELVRCEGSNKQGQIIPASWIYDIQNYNEKLAWQSQNNLERFPNGNYRSKWYQSGFQDNEFCAIGIHGQNIWINPKKELTIIRMSSASDPINIDTEELMFSVFETIANELT